MKWRLLFPIAATLLVATIGVSRAEDEFGFFDLDEPLDCDVAQYQFNTGLEIYPAPSYTAERIFAVHELSPYVAARDLSGEWLYIFFFDEEDLRGGWVPLAQVAVPIEDYNELCVGSGGVVPDKPNLGYDDTAAVKVDRIIVTNTPTAASPPISRPPTHVPLPTNSPVPPPPTNTPVPPPPPTNTPIPPPVTPIFSDTPMPPTVTEPGGPPQFTPTQTPDPPTATWTAVNALVATFTPTDPGG